MLFGLETELAFSVHTEGVRSPGQRGELRQRGEFLTELFSLAHKRLLSLPEASKSLFLANGSRLYLDSGMHPELCTPECRTPAEVVCWQLAGERLLAQLARELEKRHPGTSVSLFRCNVDYGGKATWGCHENYQHRTTAEKLARQLVPHLVTRIVYTGAGGFNNLVDPLQFLVSPRVPHLVHEIGRDGTPQRGIYHTKDQPLSKGGFHRLHLMCGESLCSQLSNYLKIGTTALLVRLVDAGLCPGSGLAFRSPLQAMKAFARDSRCRARARLADGRRLTAIEVQAEYLAMVEKHLSADFMPDWAPEVCRRWRRVLEQLSSDPTSLAGSLDWAIKLALFKDHLKRGRGSKRRLRTRAGVGARLCEIDMRFGELGENGPFFALDRQGALDHRIPELGSVKDAMSRPPPGGRAAARGRAIRRLHSARSRYQCGWDSIRDTQASRVLDLSDPFVTAPRWKSMARRKRRSGENRIPAQIERQINEGYRHYDRMDLDRAFQVLDGAIRSAREAGNHEGEALASFWCASAHQDLARLDAAESVLVPALAAVERDVSDGTRCRVLTRYALVRIERPAPRAELDDAMERAREATRRADGDIGKSRLSMLDARLLGLYGQYSAAVAVMERAIREASFDPISFNPGSYFYRLASFACRLGDPERTRSAIERWRPVAEASYRGVRLLCAESALARLEGRASEALQHASAAIERSNGVRRHRSRIEACLAFVDSAHAAAQPDRAQPFYEELLTWRDVQIGELRDEVRRVESLYHCDSPSRGAPEPSGRPTRGVSRPSGSGSAAAGAGR